MYLMFVFVVFVGDLQLVAILVLVLDPGWGPGHATVWHIETFSSES